MGKVYGVISIKGGVGKTTAVSNLGAALANVFHKTVLVVDANFSAPNLGLHLGVLNVDRTLHDVLSGKCWMENVIYDTEHGFHLVPSALRGSGKIKHMELKKYIKKVKEYYDIVLIDSSPNLNQEILATMAASDELLVVTTPDYPTLSSTMHAVKIAKRKKTPITGLILNKVYNKNFELTLEDIEEAADAPVLAVLPHDMKVLEALSETKPAALHAPKSDAVVEYCKLAASLVGEDYKDPRLFQRMLGSLREKQKQEVNREELGYLAKK